MTAKVLRKVKSKKQLIQVGQVRERHHRKRPKIFTVLSVLYRRGYEEWKPPADLKERWESTNSAFTSKVKETKVVEGIGYRPNLKCSWPESVIIYRDSVLQAQRDT